jgi:hypothetical protein
LLLRIDACHRAPDDVSSAPGVSGCHPSAPADTNESGDARPVNDETPSEEGVSSEGVSDCQEKAVDVSSGGGGDANCQLLALYNLLFRNDLWQTHKFDHMDFGGETRQITG